MKKHVMAALVLLLSALLLWGCSEEKKPAPAPTESVTLYYNLDKGAQLIPDANGAYTVHFAAGAEKKSYTVTDKALLDQLLLLDFVGLELDGNTITGIIRMPDLPYQRLAWNYYVQSVGGNTVKLNILSTFVGREVLLKLPEGLKIYDITPDAASFGAVTTLQKNDCVSVIADESGELLFGYVTSRPSTPHQGLVYCQHCDSEVSWDDWISDSSLPSSAGHYLLQKDVTVARETKISGAQICLDLNGKAITQAAYGQRIYALQNGGCLNLMDSVGGGIMISNSSDESQTAKYGMVILINHENSVFNLYGGTLDGTNTTAQTGATVSLRDGTFNMYGGTILGGTVYGTGSSAVSASGTFTMYDGRIVGGKHISTDYEPLNPPGGGAIRVLGTTTIYGGIIEGGESYSQGGVIRLTPDAAESDVVKLVLKGGTITGGKAPQGGGIYALSDTTVIISGNPKVIGNEGGNLFVEDGATVTIGEEGLGEEAQIGISRAEGGKVLSEIPQGVDVSAHFISDDASKRLVSTGDGNYDLR